MTETLSDYPLLAMFVAVAQEGSFTRAAKRLGIGKGTASRAVSELEQRLGTELIHRTTRAVALSTAGAVLYERTASHLSALSQAVLKLPELAAEPSGELRLTAAHDFGIVVLPEMLARFARRYPDIRVDVRLTNVHLDLVKEGYDLAIRAASSRLKDSTLTVRRLGAPKMSFFASPSYLARRGTPEGLYDFGHDWILHSAVRVGVKVPRDAQARFLCDDFLLIHALALEGAGIGMLPHTVAARSVQEGLLEEMPLGPGASLAGTVFLVYPSSGEVPRKVTAFRDFLVDWLKKSPLE